jgi:hypothetical protein
MNVEKRKIRRKRDMKRKEKWRTRERIINKNYGKIEKAKMQKKRKVELQEE